MKEISESLFNDLDKSIPDISLIDEAWIAWSAGFLDGEGAIMLHRHLKPGQVNLAVRASQVNEAPLERLRLMYGGSVRKLTKQNIYQWSINGEAASRALAAMRPYLMVKGAHADLAIEFQYQCFRKDIDKLQRNEAKERYYEELSKLQVKGPSRSELIDNRRV